MGFGRKWGQCLYTYILVFPEGRLYLKVRRFCDPKRTSSCLHRGKLGFSVGVYFYFKKLDFMIIWLIYFPEVLEEPSEDVTSCQEGTSAESTVENRVDTGELSCSL